MSRELNNRHVDVVVAGSAAALVVVVVVVGDWGAEAAAPNALNLSLSNVRETIEHHCHVAHHASSATEAEVCD